MLTKIKKMFVLVMFATFAFVLFGCSSGGIKGGLKALSLPESVTEDFTLPTVAVEGAVTTWTSSDTNIIKIEETYAEISRPSLKDAEVTLTATVTLGEETASKDFVVIVKCKSAPDAININPGNMKADTEQADYYYLKAKDSVQLVIEVDDEEMSTEVTWTVSNTKRAEISEDGVLTGKAYGKVTVTATSTSVGAGGAAITDKITVEIVEDTNPMQVLLNNKKKIEEKIPRFISADYTFPMAENEDVTTVYSYSSGEELYYGEYVYVEGPDRQEAISCVLEYKGQTTEFTFVISVVENEEDNEFLAIEETKEALNEVFAKYVSSEKISANVDIFEELETQYHDDKGEVVTTNVKYSVETDYQPYPFSFSEVENSDGESVLTGVYTKPNDDVTVRVEAYITAVNVDDVVRFNVKVAGYTNEEKVAYFKANVLPQPNEAGKYSVTCGHITLPTSDTTGKFANAEITWASSDTSVITDAGRFANLELSEATKVTLTATIKYSGTVSSAYAFEETVSFEYDVYPAENEAQKVSLQLSEYINKDEFMSTISYFPFGKSDRLDADGNITNVMPLPLTIGAIAPELTEYADIAITWTANEEGLLDENYKLLKQYLRYHEVVLTYAVEVDGKVATNEVVINVGIAELKNTIYMGGNWYQQSGGGIYTGDVLCQLSKFDSPVGTLNSAALKWGYSYSHGEFRGYTWYIDEVDENGKVTRYQYYSQANGFFTLDDMYKVYLATEGDATSVTVQLNTELNSLIDSQYGGNWGSVFHNVTDHEIKVPLAPLSGQAFNGSAEVKWSTHPWNKSGVIARDNAFAIDGYRCGFVCDAEGNVVTGFGETNFQTNYDVNGDNQLTDDDYWVTIPAGGYAYTPRTQQNNATLVGRFCVVGTKLNISYFEPYSVSPDGSAEGLGSFTHVQ